MSELLDDLFEEALSIRRKGNKTKNLRSVAGRVSRQASEVMVKVSGFGKGASHIRAHLTYISRHGKVELETETGEILENRDEISQHFEGWKRDIDDSRQRKNRRDTMHLILSMPDSVDEESVRRASREFAKETFGANHRYVFALHTDSNNPHCHITVRCEGRDGRKLNPRKADLQAWREAFAEKIREQGYEAEATPRRARGIVRKAQRAVVRHIETGDRTHKPRVSRVRAAKTKEIAQELPQGSPAKDKPWEKAIQARQEKVRQSWLAASVELEKRDAEKSLPLAQQIRQMVDNMPPVKTERQIMKEELKQNFRRHPEKGKERDSRAATVPLSRQKDRDRER